MSVDELKAIAVEMKTPNSYSDVKAQLVYDILDKQAEMSAADSDAAPKRRRIASAPHDHVYSATQAGESERFDSARDERAAKKQIAEKARVEAAAAAEALVGAGEVVAEAPKRRRGRPTKAEVEAKKAAEEQEQKEPRQPRRKRRTRRTPPTRARRHRNIRTQTNPPRSKKTPLRRKRRKTRICRISSSNK